jgi:hypothetical protein
MLCNPLSSLWASIAFAIGAVLTIAPDHVLADPQIDAQRLALAQARAEQRWERLAVPAEGQLHDLALLKTGEGIVGLIVVNLDFESPDRDNDVLRYVNITLLPSIRSRRAEYVCAITKEFYYSTVPTSALPTFEMPGLSFIYELMWFSLPTLPYLQRENLRFGSNAQQFFDAVRADRDRFHFGVWNGGTDSHLPCEAEHVSLGPKKWVEYGLPGSGKAIEK